MIEVLVASIIGMIALTGILYFYNAHNKNMVIQSGISMMRMNGQYALEETEYILSHAGLGLPSRFPYLVQNGNDLIVRRNSSKRHTSGIKSATSTGNQTIFQIPVADMELFSGAAYALTRPDRGASESPVLDVSPEPGNPSSAMLTLQGGKNLFQDVAEIYPVERERIHRCTGTGADTIAGELRIQSEDPGLRKQVKHDTLSLAEGIESVSYKFLTTSNKSGSTLPSSLDSLKQIQIEVVVKSLVHDRNATGDGYSRDTLRASVNYRRRF